MEIRYNLSKSLSNSKNEKDVENAYRAYLSELISDSEPWFSPCGVDGILPVPSTGNSLLAEFKHNVDMESPTERAKVLAQVVYYLKRLEADPHARRLPTALMVGDINEFFVMDTNPLMKYLSWDLDWRIAPSSAWTVGKLVLALAQDEEIKVWVWSPQAGNWTHKDLHEKIIGFLSGRDYQVAISPASMITVFKRWQDIVLHKASKESLTPQEQVSAFMKCLLSRDEVYEHPKKKTFLIVENSDGSRIEMRTNKGSNDAFWKHFRSKYTFSEKQAFTADKDRLVQEEARRRTGEYFTPLAWVEEAHKHLDKELGPNWKEEYVVWDCSCGTANLTREFQFKNLFLSTLNREDADTIRAMRYNGAGMPEGATVFQYDFLNDPYEKLPVELRKALEDPKQKFLFLNNPPYGTGANKKVIGGTEQEGKAGTTKNSISDEMKKNGLSGSAQLYTQFMYRMAKFVEGRENVSVALFCKSFHMRSSSFRKFSDWWTERFHSNGGFLFRANEFADVSGAWAICWNVWSSGAEQPGKTSWDFDLKRRIREGADDRIVDIGTKKLWLSDWKPSSVIEDKEYDTERKKNEIKHNWRLTGATSPKTNQGTTYKPFSFSNNDACYYVKGNFDSPIDKCQMIYSASSCTMHSGHVPPSKIRQFAPVMNLRDLAQATWCNEKDEFLAPNESHPLWERWFAESLLYLPLCGKGEFSGLRNLQFPDENGIVQNYTVKNHWALLENQEVLDLADETENHELFADAQYYSSPPRMVTPIYEQVLQNEPVSDLAKEVFNGARELVRLATLSGSRRLMQDEQPELHLQAWDAGWKQFVPVLKAYHTEEYKAWKEKYDSWRSELREILYDLGYLVRTEFYSEEETSEEGEEV